MENENLQAETFQKALESGRPPQRYYTWSNHWLKLEKALRPTVTEFVLFDTEGQ